MIRVDKVVESLTYITAFCGLFSVITEINPLFSILFGLSVLYSNNLDRFNLYVFPRFLLNIVSVIVIAATMFRFSPDNIVQPAIEALVLIQAIKFF
jgi:cation transporter-like permease